jgi:sugar/nucleoside kinase (ribokinase family)
VNRSGDIHLEKWKGTQVLELVDLYKSSLSELKMVSEQADLRLAMKEIRNYGVEIVIVTMGVKGSMVLHEGVFYKVPACKPTVTRDLTGAGDAYAGAFLAELIRGKEPSWCSCVGSAAASFVVEGIGPTVFGEKKQIYKRADQIYEEGLSCLE